VTKYKQYKTNVQDNG